MVWSEHVFEYCERGSSSAFWAEPLNAVSNVGFVVAGLAAAAMLARTKSTPPAHRFSVFLSVMLLVVGAGSFLFHTFATRWAELADQIPITIFVFSYFSFAIVFLLDIGWRSAAVVIAVFAALSFVANGIGCTPPSPDTAPGDRVCLWGSVAYFPALAGIWIIGGLLWRMNRQTAAGILAAAAVFTLSLALRTVDTPLCDNTVWFGKAIGTHFAWHLLNACTLFILVRTAARHDSRSGLPT